MRISGHDHVQKHIFNVILNRNAVNRLVWSRSYLLSYKTYHDCGTVILVMTNGSVYLWYQFLSSGNDDITVHAARGMLENGNAVSDVLQWYTHDVKQESLTKTIDYDYMDSLLQIYVIDCNVITASFRRNEWCWYPIYSILISRYTNLSMCANSPSLVALSGQGEAITSRWGTICQHVTKWARTQP